MKYAHDDMDELFRRAAEDYPLDTGSADWNRIANALHAPEKIAPLPYSYKRILWILLLLPLPFICVHTNWMENKEATSTAATTDAIQQQTPSTTVNKNPQADQIPANKLVPSLPSTASAGTTQATTSNIGGLNRRSQEIENEVNIKAFHNQEPESNTVLVSAVSKKDLKNSAAGKVPFRSTATTGDGPFHDRTIVFPVRKRIDPDLLAINAAPSLIHLDHTFLASDHPQKSRRSEKGAYIGLVGNLGLSNVKSQWAKDMDNSLGLLFGYSFSKKWALETGLMLDKKYYVSEGKYFKGNTIWMAPNTSLMNVDGNCYMVEVPLDVRYNVRNGKKGTWFITSGVSSYLMKREAYTYNIEYYPGGNTTSHYYEYYNSTRNWFSIYEGSIGYSSQLGKIGALRVEPFARIPLKGVGIGQLPVVSYGLQLGLTHRLF